MVTMEASSTTINCATTTMARISQRLGSGPISAGLIGVVSFVGPTCPPVESIPVLFFGGIADATLLSAATPSLDGPAVEMVGSCGRRGSSFGVFTCELPEGARRVLFEMRSESRQDSPSRTLLRLGCRQAHHRLRLCSHVLRGFLRP